MVLEKAHTTTGGECIHLSSQTSTRFKHSRAQAYRRERRENRSERYHGRAATARFLPRAVTFSRLLVHVQSTCASSKGLQTLIHHSFSHNGVRLFNCAPRHIRDLTGVTKDTFKHHLDKWLADIPDQQPTPGYSSSHDNTLPSVVLEARIRELHTTPGMSGGPPQLRR
ncbi:hypothetical protein GWK47_049918 [Chionoecetes opilio]|uniref:Uncharacterized protein n=1 Tax=Chionoecetes opilio TaxID=41210 RepID=A0A8J4Y9L4_CHIOP|nr:hypothetical protein GWK47_049918 [Chionoecetes opilio]